MKKLNLKKLWNKLPKEVKVGVYVVGSAALAELVKYLSELKVDSLLLAAVINVLVVLLQTRIPQVRDRLKK